MVKFIASVLAVALATTVSALPLPTDSQGQLEAREPFSGHQIYEAGKGIYKFASKHEGDFEGAVKVATEVASLANGVKTFIKSRSYDDDEMLQERDLYPLYDRGYDDEEGLFGRDLDTFDDLAVREEPIGARSFKSNVMAGAKAAWEFNAKHPKYAKVAEAVAKDTAKIMFARNIDAEELLERDDLEPISARSWGSAWSKGVHAVEEGAQAVKNYADKHPQEVQAAKAVGKVAATVVPMFI